MVHQDIALTKQKGEKLFEKKIVLKNIVKKLFCSVNLKEMFMT